jgi:hypothetical protein
MVLDAPTSSAPPRGKIRISLLLLFACATEYAHKKTPNEGDSLVSFTKTLPKSYTIALDCQLSKQDRAEEALLL